MNESSSSWVINTTAETFEQDVFEKSKTVPVVLDFWAEWCAPCRMLGPILHELAEEYGGRIVVVKADTEQLQERAMEFRVNGIPAVFGLVGGEVVNYFEGALPKDQIKEWLEQILSSSELKAAEALETDAPAEAEAAYRKILADSPDNVEVTIALARVLAKHDGSNEAREIIAKLEARGFLEPEAQKVKAQLDLGAQSAGDLEQARADLADDPDNFNKKLALAKLLGGKEEYVEAMDLALDLVSLDRQATGEEARLLIIEILQVLPADSETVTTYRRRLSMALY